jgi:hypothetical protein
MFNQCAFQVRPAVVQKAKGRVGSPRSLPSPNRDMPGAAALRPPTVGAFACLVLPDPDVVDPQGGRADRLGGVQTEVEDQVLG